MSAYENDKLATNINCTAYPEEIHIYTFTQFTQAGWLTCRKVTEAARELNDLSGGQTYY